MFSFESNHSDHADLKNKSNFEKWTVYYFNILTLDFLSAGILKRSYY